MSTIRLSDLGVDDVGGLILASFFFSFFVFFCISI